MTRLETEHGIFIANEKDNQTAHELYEKWLANKGLSPQPTNKERIKNLESENEELATMLEFLLLELIPSIIVE